MNKDVQTILNDNAAAIAHTVVEKALAGNPAMLKLCMDKLCPQASLVQLQLLEQIKSIEALQFGMAAQAQRVE